MQSASLPELIRHLFVNRAPRTKGDDPYDPADSVNTVDNAEPPNTEFPVSLQFSLKGFTAHRIVAKSSYRLLDAAFQIRMEMANRFSNRWRNRCPEPGHYRLRFLTG